MTPMPWVRIDDDWFQHPKLLRAGGRGRLLWLAAACWASANETGGMVPVDALPMLAAAADAGPATATAKRLHEAGLWHAAGERCTDANCPATAEPVPPGHWAFHGWWQYQLTDEQRAERSEKARASARARWNGHAKRNAPSMRNALQDALPDACVTQCDRDALPRTPVVGIDNSPPPPSRVAAETGGGGRPEFSPRTLEAIRILLLDEERIARQGHHPPGSPAWYPAVRGRLERQHGPDIEALAQAHADLEPYELAARATGRSKYDLARFTRPEGGYL